MFERYGRGREQAIDNDDADIDHGPRARPSPERRRLFARAQALTEFALTLPVLILVLFGVSDIGRAYYYDVVASSAARDGARMMVLIQPPNGPGGYSNDHVCAQIESDLSGVLTSSCTDTNIAPPSTISSSSVAPYNTTPGPGQAVIIISPNEDCRTDLSGCPPGGNPSPPLYQPVYATVIYTFNPITPFFQSISPSITLHASFEMRSDW